MFGQCLKNLIRKPRAGAAELQKGEMTILAGAEEDQRKRGGSYIGRGRRGRVVAVCCSARRGRRDHWRTGSASRRARSVNGHDSRSTRTGCDICGSGSDRGWRLGRAWFGKIRTRGLHLHILVAAVDDTTTVPHAGTCQNLVSDLPPLQNLHLSLLPLCHYESSQLLLCH